MANNLYDFVTIEAKQHQEALERQGFYTDDTPVGPLEDELKNIKSPLALQYADWIRTKSHGADILESQARWGLLMTKQALDAIEQSGDAKEAAKDLSGKFNNLANEYLNFKEHVQKEKDAVIANATQDSEVILARGGKATLGQRLDETTTQLDKKWNLPNSHLVTIKHNLDFYPELIVLYSEYGIDTTNFEETPEGMSFDGTSPEQVDVRLNHPTRKEVEIYVPEEYAFETFDFYTSKDLIVLNNGVRSLTIIFGNINHENMLPVSHDGMLKLNNVKIIGG